MGPQLREPLSVADGWDHFHLFDSLLGTAEIGVGRRWESGVESAQIWFETEKWDEQIGACTGAADYQHVVASDNGYFATAFVFVGDVDELPAGSVLELPTEGDDIYPDLYSYLVVRVDEITKYT
ncbi:hypothetical protein NSK11_contig00063-0024 [Nocardia seriolae]|uniref:Uncharacterized protein n=1 Tax=Nocardia seriolae TaxID=37332 RepID=A0ABC9YXR5_9NOCA|nr:hypothetical protein NSERKGN1266_13350 [Nocardia seriolae]BEK98781.1 hypothetical protein NSER024013_66870 [Nocardia seriolae]GAM47889.1 hypothetical protein NS07_v2contig00060-0023 [Nocardia seriolae]GAP29753.1 hypothetical protein NSK11_contig00063-0024 [Nocardia seriolae]GEM25905.1 hypothetical protein NS2_41440 [Nocardia seriolae NBRC 15557]